MKNVLEIQNLHYSYHTPDGETEVLKNFSFSMKAGEFVSIVGKSGCGKSTLLSLIAGLLEPESGTIKLNDCYSPKDSTGIGYMLQKDHLFEWRTIYKNILLGLEIRHMVSRDTRCLAHELLKQYGLEEFANARPSELSGGMRQRAALVRTLVLEPDLLLLDEPFSALDYQTRLTVGDDIGQIIKKEKKTAILVTHDLSEAISLGDRVIILSERPAEILQTVVLNFNLPNDTPLHRRNSPAFKDYFNLIWKEMNKHE